MRKWLFLLLALLCLTGCTAAETGERQPELILRYADNQPDDYPTTQAAYYFADLVSQQTGGRVKIAVFSGGELGTESSVLEQMQFGGIDFTRSSLAQICEIEPSVSVLLLPYLYRDADHMWQVLDGEIGAEFLEKVQKHNLIGLSWFDAGVRNIYSVRPISGMEDLKDFRLRVQESEMMCDMAACWGATPEKIPYDQVYSALYQGKIDGAENNFSSYTAMNHSEAAPYVLLTEHCRIPEMQLISAAAMEKLEALDPGFPPIIRQCARQSALKERELWSEAQWQAERAAMNGGCVVTTPTNAEKEKFRRAVQPMYEDMEEHRELIRRIQTVGN